MKAAVVFNPAMPEEKLNNLARDSPEKPGCWQSSTLRMTAR